jgi:hypothetical protein
MLLSAVHPESPVPVQDIAQVEALFSALEIRTIYVKHLALKQDNEKNQIYLGGGLDGVTNLFPAVMASRSASESTGKRKSRKGRPKLEARIDLNWLSADGSLHPVPNARIIDYFQYPEVRLSGFLAGCRAAPDALRRDHQAQYGRRILLLGTTPDGRVAGMVLTERDDPVVASFPELPELPAAPVLRVLVIGRQRKAPADLLIEELAGIVSAGWHDSVILKPSLPDPVPFSGNQGGGYTLEALMEVPANADKKPDRYGFEIKSFSGDRISLMTPVPDGGYQGDHPFREFMARYGRPADKGDGSLRFTGMHRAGQPNARTGLVLEVSGYDRDSDEFAGDPEDICVRLADPASGEIAAQWSLGHLANAWNAKHASALYIRCRKRREPDTGRPQYAYEPEVLIGEGTDIWRLLRGIAQGLVVYDPGDAIYADGKPKVRPQWRISSARMQATMRVLYAKARSVSLPSVNPAAPRSPRQLNLL